MLRTWAGRAVLGAVLAAGVTGGLSLATAAPAAAAESGTVYVVHGVPGLTVDVYVNGKAVLTGLTNPNQQTADVAPGTVSAAVALADSTKPVIGPADLTLKAGQVTVVYAVGSAKDSTLRLVTQSLAAAQAQMPQGVNAGSGGL